MNHERCHPTIFFASNDHNFFLFLKSSYFSRIYLDISQSGTIFFVMHTLSIYSLLFFFFNFSFLENFLFSFFAFLSQGLLLSVCYINTFVAYLQYWSLPLSEWSPNNVWMRLEFWGRSG